MTRYSYTIYYSTNVNEIYNDTYTSKIRHISNCMKADPVYGKGLADVLGISLEMYTESI